MRLTNSTLLRGYNRDLQRLKTEKNACERKITSTRKFSRASEAPLLAAKALNVRKSLYYSEQYQENLKVAQKFYTEAETSLLQVSTKMADIRETIIAAVNTTKDNVDYNIYAQQLETFAHELCTIFNTDSAGRAIFGGESDSSIPFTIINDANGNASIVLYHGVPVNALDDYMGFPFTNPVYMDIGLGMVTDQTTHAQDPMSVLDISFNGAKISGCGAEYGIADIDLTSIKENRNYALDVYADGVKHTITFRGKGTQQENIDQINAALAEAFQKEKAEGKNIPVMDDQGMVYLQDKYGNALDKGIVSIVNNTTLTNSGRIEQLVVENDSNYTNKYKVNFDALEENKLYTIDVEVNGERKTITFMSGADDIENGIYREEESLKNLQAALDEAFGTDPDTGKSLVTITDHAPNKGVISTEGGTVKLYATIDHYEDVDLETSAADAAFERERIYSNNYIQLTLDAARALRHGDIEYANGCIDRLVSASESLLAEIANIGCNEDFCDFNLERLTTRDENLAERQNELEITDPEYQITLWKTYEAYYNACLQMSASVVPNSIFNYMK